MLLLAVILAHCLTLPAVAQSWAVPEESRLVGEDKTVSASSGQSLYDIARAHGYSLEHLAHANAMAISLAPIGKRSVLIPSRRIVPTEPPKSGLVVNIPERGFYIFESDESPRFFPVAVGEPGRFQTPLGNFAIREKVINPEWIAPEWAGLGENNVIPAGPDNPLGDRWIGLNSSGLGMHSTNKPSSIGSATSHGCMRMYPEVAHTVFDLVKTGWPVRIEYETSRLTIEDDGLYVACFTDPYRRGGAKKNLEDKFRKQDLMGFYELLDLETLLKKQDGIATRVVDLDTKVQIPDSPPLPAARIGQRVFVTGDTLTAMGLGQSFDLANRTVLLKKGELEMIMPLKLQDAVASQDILSNKTYGFLSRGASWFPAKELLQTMAIPYKWDGATKTLQVQL